MGTFAYSLLEAMGERTVVEGAGMALAGCWGGGMIWLVLRLAVCDVGCD